MQAEDTNTSEPEMSSSDDSSTNDETDEAQSRAKREAGGW